MALSLACNILSRQGETEPLLPAALFLLDGFEDDFRHRAGKENRVCRRGDMRWAAPQNFFIKESQPLLLSFLPDAEKRPRIVRIKRIGMREADSYSLN